MLRFKGFSRTAGHTLSRALQLAGQQGQSGAGTGHLLLAILMQPGDPAAGFLRARQVDQVRVEQRVERLGQGEPVRLRAGDFLPEARKAMDYALLGARTAQRREAENEHLLCAILEDPACTASLWLSDMGLELGEAARACRRMSGQLVMPAPPRTTASYPQRGSRPSEKYGRDLTRMASERSLDPVLCRDEELERLVEILCRRQKNNPCLIGEPGVGKTAIVEGLAQKIVRGDVPEPLKGKRLVVLDIAGMVAGAKFRGDFEERIKGALQEAADSSDVLLFIDEIHTIIGAGSSEGALDAANIMKPMLSRGEIQVIGATTVDEYRKHIEKDAALERRFQSIMVEEPSEEQCVEILKGIRSAYERHHQVTVTDEAIDACVRLSKRYITDRFLPDKAIDLMDEACSRRQLQTYYHREGQAGKDLDTLASRRRELESALSSGDLEQARSLHTEIEALERRTGRTVSPKSTARTVTMEDIARTVSEWTKIPVTRLTESESRKLLGLEKTLHRRIVGQSEAVEAVSRAIRRGRAGLRDPGRPVGSFLFLGPTGVGKTELSKALAEAVFGSEKNIIRVDMSEYMEKFDVSKMIGSPPGYVGYDEGGQLSERVRRHPYSVVLFDEIEKAHPDIFNILLQVLDEGHITDAQGRKVDFRNTVIIMTSNAGAQQIIAPKKLGFGVGGDVKADYEAMKSSVMGEVNRLFRPEFLNRIDDIIVFHPLQKPEIRQIADLIIDRLIARAGAQADVTLKVRPAVRDRIAEKGFDPKFGARPIRRAVQTEIEDALSEEILQGRVKKGSTAVCSLKDGKIVFQEEKVK